MMPQLTCFLTLAPVPRFRHRGLHRSTTRSQDYQGNGTKRLVRSLLYNPPTPPSTPLSPVVILPGLGNASGDYIALAERLASRGHSTVSIVPVARWQWGLNARGLFTAAYWRGTLEPAQVLSWYFAAVDTALAEVRDAAPGAPLSLLGHSAGGWLARVYVAERAPEDLEIAALVTLGTPHRSPPRGRADQSRGLLTYIERECDVSGKVGEFVCVAGRGTVGKPFGKGSAEELIAYLSYEGVCGEGAVDGDGITPVEAACATGGKLVVCDDCQHSMLSAERWYGTGAAYDRWVEFLP